ncbi:SDR family oxidoreductase [Rhodococcus kroppenstedtii]|uniref:SDR family oxidoreductase n=1 Tax=Rhodococcoides kroppenstedtii TaxID=293050 RepID=UPI002954E87D|nr:SDR family oxidoreductase [Rhodococcus kroppenstedtii]MDV7199100.1 SDR family oxidoreductase [Rhodococcus kroppenstedtii]
MSPTALVTGAGRGLGAGIVRLLAADHDVLIGGTTADSVAAVSEELGATPWPVDLTDADALRTATADVDSLDVLVHNAGVADLGTVEDLTLADWRHTFEANVFAVAELTRLLLPALRRTHGHVVLINSGAGLRANPRWSAYAASKFALRAFGDALRQEEPDIRVTSVHPGRIDTDMQRAIVAGEGKSYDGSQYLSVDTVARAVRHAIDTPADAHPTEIVLRPR